MNGSLGRNRGGSYRLSCASSHPRSTLLWHQTSPVPPQPRLCAPAPALAAVPDRPTVQCDGVVGGAAVSDLSFGDHPPCRLLGKGKAGSGERESLSALLPFFSDKQSLLILPPSSEAVLVYTGVPPEELPSEREACSRNLSSVRVAVPDTLALTLVACSFFF